MPTKEALVELRKMAEACDDDERVAVAVELFALYLKYCPADTSARLQLGRGLHILGLMQEAEAEYLTARAESAGVPNWRVDMCLGELYKNLSKHDLAEEHYQRCCSTAGAPDWIWILRGGNLARAGRLHEAEECHRKAATLEDCDRDEAYLSLGLVLRARGNYAAAESAFRSALEITPDYSEALDGLQSVAGMSESLEFAKQLLAE
jgi:tetratricopeptide (TPR) repeat protein